MAILSGYRCQVFILGACNTQRSAVGAIYRYLEHLKGWTSTKEAALPVQTDSECKRRPHSMKVTYHMLQLRCKLC